MRVQPYLVFDGRCEEALTFYKAALGAEILSLMRFKDSPLPGDLDGRPPDTGDKIMNASFRLGDSLLMASDGRCGGKPEFKGVSLSITLPDAAQADQIFAALAQGGSVGYVCERGSTALCQPCLHRPPRVRPALRLARIRPCCFGAGRALTISCRAARRKCRLIFWRAFWI